MTRPTQAQGRPGTVVVPPEWAASHAVVVDKTHASTVSIGTAGGPPAWNSTTKQTETAAAPPVYAGRASIMAVSNKDHLEQVVDDPTVSRIYEVTLPYAASALVAVGHVVTVASTDPDPALAGSALRVTAIERGSRRFSRVLLAVLLD